MINSCPVSQMKRFLFMNGRDNDVIENIINYSTHYYFQKNSRVTRVL